MLITTRVTDRSTRPSTIRSSSGCSVGSPPLSITRSSRPPSRSSAASTLASTEAAGAYRSRPGWLPAKQTGQARLQSSVRSHTQDARVLLLERAQPVQVPHRDRARVGGLVRHQPLRRDPPLLELPPQDGVLLVQAHDLAVAAPAPAPEPDRARLPRPARPGGRPARSPGRGPGARGGTRRTGRAPSGGAGTGARCRQWSTRTIAWSQSERAGGRDAEAGHDHEQDERDGQDRHERPCRALAKARARLDPQRTRWRR